jgi:hypothetical protein
MPGKVAKIGTFSDWAGLFDEWRKEIGVDRDEIASFKFDTLYGAIETEEIQFGSTQVGEPAAGSDATDAGCLVEHDRVPGGYRVRVGRAAAAFV